MRDDEPSRLGRPRKWADEAERKRAYRRRMAEQLADPLAARAAAREAEDKAAAAHRRAAQVDADARRWRRRAEGAEGRVERATVRARQATRDARQARKERDRAGDLLRSKLQWAGKASELRGDPDKLLALIAELNQTCAQYRLRAERAERILFRNLPYDAIAEEYERP